MLQSFGKDKAPGHIQILKMLLTKERPFIDTNIFHMLQFLDTELAHSYGTEIPLGLNNTQVSGIVDRKQTPANVSNLCG